MHTHPSISAHRFQLLARRWSFAVVSRVLLLAAVAMCFWFIVTHHWARAGYVVTYTMLCLALLAELHCVVSMLRSLLCTIYVPYVLAGMCLSRVCMAWTYNILGYYLPIDPPRMILWYATCSTAVDCMAALVAAWLCIRTRAHATLMTHGNVTLLYMTTLITVTVVDIAAWLDAWLLGSSNIATVSSLMARYGWLFTLSRVSVLATGISGGLVSLYAVQGLRAGWLQTFGYCSRCGYNLSGTPNGICSECGATARHTVA